MADCQRAGLCLTVAKTSKYQTDSGVVSIFFWFSVSFVRIVSLCGSTFPSSWILCLFCPLQKYNWSSVFSCTNCIIYGILRADAIIFLLTSSKSQFLRLLCEIFKIWSQNHVLRGSLVWNTEARMSLKWRNSIVRWMKARHHIIWQCFPLQIWSCLFDQRKGNSIRSVEGRRYRGIIVILISQDIWRIWTFPIFVKFGNMRW